MSHIPIVANIATVDHFYRESEQEYYVPNQIIECTWVRLRRFYWSPNLHPWIVSVRAKRARKIVFHDFKSSESNIDTNICTYYFCQNILDIVPLNQIMNSTLSHTHNISKYYGRWRTTYWSCKRRSVPIPQPQSLGYVSYGYLVLSLAVWINKLW